jgi:hypothetical protein
MNPFIQLRGAFYLLVLVVVCAIPFALAQRNATSKSVVKHGSASKRLAGVGSALPANLIVVTNTNDSGPSSLRDALAAANDGDTIDATGVSGTILLTSGELQINHNVTINGPGAANLALNGNATFRVFENFASNVTFSGFTITNGLPPTGDNNGGGGILNHGGLTLSDSSVLNNKAGGPPPGASGGGINTVGILKVMSSVISSNSAGLFGGGISLGAGTATVIDSTISGNNAIPRLHCDACGNGGGIASFGTLTVTNSTISGNRANSNAGGILCDGGGTLTVTNSTISGNGANRGTGGIDNLGTTTIRDTVLNGTGTIVNDGGTVTSLGYNLASDGGGGVLTGPGDQINTDPMLGPLQDNGGPTFTHALLPGSPAIDTGDPNFMPPPFYDQRGPDFDRVVDGRYVDIGSFEVQATPIPRDTPTPKPRPISWPRTPR